MIGLGSILIVRLSSMGDIIHAIPAFSALRAGFPKARIDWLVDRRFQEIVEMVDGVDNVVPWELSSLSRVLRRLRSTRYDLAVDFQGLIRSGLLARMTGAQQILGFSASHVRERPAALFYNRVHAPPEYGHVIFKNLSLVRSIVPGEKTVRFPWKESSSLPIESDKGRYAVLIPGASWKHKQWPAASYGELAARLRERHGLRSVLTHGNSGELRLAERAAATSQGAAVISPGISIAGLFDLIRRATLVVGGDTGPLHLAAAAGRPVVGLYGPTNPRRNGPWSDHDLVVSRYGECGCRYRRRCTRRRSCILDIEVADVVEAADLRLQKETTI